MRLSHLTKKQRSKISERALAKQLGGRVQPASGSLPVKNLKGDVITKDWLIDDKITGMKSFSVKLEDFRKMRRQAFGVHRKPAMRVNFEDGLVVYVIEERDFLPLIEEKE